MKKFPPVTILFIFALSIIGGFMGGFAANVHTTDELISEYYEIENAVMVSPHGLRKDMMQGKENYLIVDLRSAEEYEREHIRGAVNIPAYVNPDKSAYDQVDRIVAEFKALPQDKDIVVYCYSTPCMTGRKVGKMLAHEGIYVKHLGIGWNDWRYDWNAWNHEHEWNQTNVTDYIWSGAEPGPKVNTTGKACPIGGEFGC
jgi:rhodanese-related sulfurtransferase